AVFQLEVFVQLFVEGILAPGMDSHNLSLPWFHITSHGREVLASSEPQPYDPTGYLSRLRERVANPDPIVIAYLAESLETFRKNNRGAGADHEHRFRCQQFRRQRLLSAFRLPAAERGRGCRSRVRALLVSRSAGQFFARADI